MYTPTISKEYDDGFKCVVESELENITNKSYSNTDNILDKMFSMNILQTVLKSLKRNKAPGWDSISAEYIIYGSETLLSCLLRIFNCINRFEYVPLYFKRGIIIPIPKGDKNKLLKDNHRGITLICVFAKLYEKCIMNRIEDWNIDKNVIDCLQGALQKQCSSLHVSWLVREIIAKKNKDNKPVYIGLMDIKKAYDSVWQDGLFYKLYKIGINGKTWHILKQLYKGFKCQIRVATFLSADFEALLGIHQGAPCSLFNHAIFNNDLIMEIKQCMVKIKMSNEIVTCPSFADDMTIMSLSKEGLQILVDIAYHYSKKWRFEFNPTKCKVMIFGKDTNPRLNVKLGNHIIEVSDCEKHLGVDLCTSEKIKEKSVQSRIVQCKSILHGIQAIGSISVPVTPVISSKLYKSVCIPKLLYGCEVSKLSQQTIDDLELFHVKAAKTLQHLPDCASNCGSLITIGWPSLMSYVVIAQMLFLWKILLLPMSNLYKTVIVNIIMKIVNESEQNLYSPTANILQICKKYNMMDIIINCILSGEYISITQWKRIVKENVYNYDSKRLNVTCDLNKSLLFLKKIKVNSISPLWIHCYKNVHELRKVKKCIQLLIGSCRQMKGICISCNECKISLDHLLFNCKKFNDTRIKLWNDVIAVSPNGLVKDFQCMDSIDKLKLLLNGLNISYNSEWSELYSAIIRFVYIMSTNVTNESCK